MISLEFMDVDFKGVTHQCNPVTGSSLNFWIQIGQGEKGTVNTWNNDRQFGFAPRPRGLDCGQLLSV